MKMISSLKGLLLLAGALLFIGVFLFPFFFSPYLEIPVHTRDDMPQGIEGMIERTRLFLLEATIGSPLEEDTQVLPLDIHTTSRDGYGSLGGREYRAGADVYRVVPVSGIREKGIELMMYSFVKNGMSLATVPMCYGVDFPVFGSRLVDGKLALAYLQGDCQSAHIATFYDDRILVSDNFSDVAHVFSYDGQLGFINAHLAEGSVVVFDGHVVSDFFDDIPTHACCLPDFWPRFDIYQNGTLVFMGERDGRHFLVRTRLR